MNNVSLKEGWYLEIPQVHVEPLTITLIKETYNGQSEKYLVKLIFFKDPTYSASDLCEFKISLFEYGNL